MFQEIKTLGDLLTALQACDENQLKQPLQVCKGHPVDEHVHALQKGIVFGTLDALEIRYARSVVDNRRHGDDLVIYTDGNPFGKEGAKAYMLVDPNDDPNENISSKELFERMKQRPIHPENHDDSADWTGPAQKIEDVKQNKSGDKLESAIINSRINK